MPIDVNILSNFFIVVIFLYRFDIVLSLLALSIVVASRVMFFLIERRAFRSVVENTAKIESSSDELSGKIVETRRRLSRRATFSGSLDKKKFEALQNMQKVNEAGGTAKAVDKVLSKNLAKPEDRMDQELVKKYVLDMFQAPLSCWSFNR